MWIRYIVACLPFVVLTSQMAFLPQLAAQEPQRMTLSSPGQHAVMGEAEKLRVAIPLFAHALTADEAIETLRKRKQTARERCLTLQADPDSIEYSGVTVEHSELLQNNSYAMLQRINNRNGNQLDLDELPTLITARVDMVIDWTLPDTDEEALVAFAEYLLRELKTPDITGEQERPEFPARVEEALEAARTQAAVYSSRSNRPSLDEIRYAFVAKVTPEMIKTAHQKAFREAEASITAMAEAAGFQLEKMLSMSSNNSTSSTTYSSSANSRNRRDLLIAGDNEIIGTSASELPYSIRIHLQYSVISQ